MALTFASWVLFWPVLSPGQVRKCLVSRQQSQSVPHCCEPWRGMCNQTGKPPCNAHFSGGDGRPSSSDDSVCQVQLGPPRLDHGPVPYLTAPLPPVTPRDKNSCKQTHGSERQHSSYSRVAPRRETANSAVVGAAPTGKASSSERHQGCSGTYREVSLNTWPDQHRLQPESFFSNFVLFFFPLHVWSEDWQGGGWTG